MNKGQKGQSSIMIEADISNLQHFSTGDGPGIRTTVFFKGCNLNCEWCHNPETISPAPSLMFYQKRCTNCGICAKNCPSKVHTLVNEEHFVNFSKCQQYGACVKHCTANALELCGSKKSIEEVMSYIIEDKEFYDVSGGGVTLSGGEPLLQPDYCEALAKACQSANINVIIDTAGNVSYDIFKRLLPYTSQFYFDLKAATENDYAEKTGGSLKIVIENMSRLFADGADVVVRVPIIPGFSDTPEYCRKLGELIKGTGIKNVSLLPFHRLGTSKYKALGLNYKYENVLPLSNAAMCSLISAFPGELNVKIDG